MSSWALALALVGALAYAVLSHLLMLHASGSPWTVVLILGPLVVISAALAGRARQWAMFAGVVAVGVGLLVLVPRGDLGDPTRLYLLQHAGTHAAMGVAFAATLRKPLSMIGQFAQQVHAEPLTPEMVRYTRAVTLVWVGYFFAMTAASVLLHTLEWREAWSLLASVGTPVLALTLFVGEYLARYRLHPEFERVRFSDAIRAYRAHRAATLAASESAR